MGVYCACTGPQQPNHTVLVPPGTGQVEGTVPEVSNCLLQQNRTISRRGREMGKVMHSSAYPTGCRAGEDGVWRFAREKGESAEGGREEELQT